VADQATAEHGYIALRTDRDLLFRFGTKIVLLWGGLLFSRICRCFDIMELKTSVDVIPKMDATIGVITNPIH
jgi:hypothetical protein